MVRFLPLAIFTSLALLVVGCATPPPAPASDASLVRESLQVDGLSIKLEYAEQTRGQMPFIKEALKSGVRTARRWGALSGTLRVAVYPDRAALQRAVGKRELEWLQAWTTANDLALAAPDAHSRNTPAAQGRYKKLVAHELTHVAHFRQADIGATTLGANNPFWFREGLAIVTAEELAHYPTQAAVVKYLRANPKADVLDPSDEDLERRSSIFYAAAALYVQALIREHGDLKIAQVIEGVRQGAFFDPGLFDRAFHNAYRLTPEQWDAHMRTQLLR